MKPGFKIFLPTLVGLLLLLAVIMCASLMDYLESPASRHVTVGLIFIALFVIGGLGAAVELCLRRPLLRLVRMMESGKDGITSSTFNPRSKEVEALIKAWSEVQNEAASNKRRTQKEVRRRKRAERALRASRKRYGLALRVANNGGWEWNLKSGEVKFSSRWKRMLGYRDDEIADRLDEWRLRIHPDDREEALREFEDCISGHTSGYAHEHRLAHRDGTYLWTMARGHALRSANGSVYRFLGLHTDISERKRLEQILWLVADATASVTGDEFFKALVRNFAAALEVRYALISECVNHPTTRVRVLAFWNGDEFVKSFDYPLEGTPCKEVVECGRLCFHPQKVQQIFPDEKALIELGAESYLGLPIQDATGRVIGHLAFLDEKPMSTGLIAESVFKIFTSRAAAEMVRLHAEKAVREAGVKLAVVETELEIAEQIQKSLLPTDPILVSSATCVGQCIPASRVGGDYFDCFPRGDDAVDVVIADVSGHGVGAALFMVQARSVLRAEAGTDIRPAQLLQTLNSLLYEDLDRAEAFITLFFARFDGERRELVYASAGHNPPLLYRPGRRDCQELDADGLILGVVKDIAFDERRVSMRAGDVVLFYTDGITEARNGAGELFGTERLGAALVRHGENPPQQLIEAILGEVRDFSVALSDDVTLVAMQVTT